MCGRGLARPDRNWQHRATGLARAKRRACVERLDRFPKLRLDILASELDLVQLRLAAIAEPRESIELVRPALALDHEPPRRGRPDRTVRRSRPTEEHFAFVHGNVTALVVVHDLHGDVAGELIEDLVTWID